MATIDLTPLYRSTVGYDRLASLLDSALRGDQSTSAYPPYDIEMHDDNRYSIRLAVAGFEKNELDIQVEKGVLTVRGRKAKDDDTGQYLYQGIANQPFERQFNLAEYIEVTGADLNNGLLTINLVKEVPEAMKPKTIAINQPESNVIEHQADEAKED